MKNTLLVLSLVLASVCAGAQSYGGTALQNSSGNYARVVPSAPVTVCSISDTAVPCTNKAATFTDQTLGTPCTLSSNAIGAPTSGTGCNNPGVADTNGNWTVFLAPGNYKVCVYAQNYLCGTITVASTSTGGGSFTLIAAGINSGKALGIGAGGTFLPSSTGQIQGTSVLIPTAAQTAPGGVVHTSLAPATNGNNVVAWSQNGDASWDTFMGIDTFCDNTAGPPCNAGGAGTGGTPIIYKRIGFNDTGVSPQSGKNSLVSINHNFGSIQTSNGNQNRGLDIETTNPASDSATVYGYYSLMSEMTFNGTPTFSAHPDGDVTTGAFSIGDNHTGSISSTVYGFSGTRQLVQRQNTGNWTSCPDSNCWIGSSIIVQNVNNGGANGAGMAGIQVVVNDIVAGSANFFGRAVDIVNPALGGGNRLSGGNWGLYIHDFGSNSSDYNLESIASAAEQGKNYLDGKTFLNHIQTSGAGHAVAAPTCASTGTGGSPSCALATGSNDSYGKMIITAGSAPGASGTATLTYNATYSTNATSCVFLLSNEGTGSWNARATVIAGAQGTGSAVINWDNNAVSLIAASTYRVNYHCGGI